MATEFKKISVEKSVHDKLKKDRELLGCKSISATIEVYMREAGL